MKILIFGASGPVGGVVTRLAVERGYDVKLFVRDVEKAEQKLADLLKSKSKENIEIIEGSLDQLWTAIEAAKDCDAIVSCVHLSFAKDIVKVAKWNRVKRVVLYSSTRLFSEVPCPSVNKVEKGEAVIKASGLDWTLLRPTMVVDYPNDLNVSKLAGFIKKYPVIPIPGSGKQLVQPVHVSDCAKATLDCLETEKAIGEALTIAGGEVLTYREMLKILSDYIDRKPIMVSVPLLPFQLLYSVFPFVFRKVGIEKPMIDRMAEDKNFDISHTAEVIDYQPLKFEKMLKREGFLTFSFGVDA